MNGRQKVVCAVLVGVGSFGCMDRTISPVVREDFEPATLLREDVPTYPEWAIEQGVGDTVGVQVLVGVDSTMKALWFERPARHQDFDSAVAQALRKSRWNPAKSQGNPVESWCSKRYVFEL